MIEERPLSERSANGFPFKYRVTKPVTKIKYEFILKEIVDWCEDCLGGRFVFIGTAYTYDSTNTKILIFWVETDEDAVLFKLRWL